MKNTKAQNITAIITIVTSLLKSLKSDQLVILVRNINKVKLAILRIAELTKKKISLQCLKDNSKTWSWTEGQQGKVVQT